MIENDHEELVEGRIESKERMDGRSLIRLGASILVAYFVVYAINSFDFNTMIVLNASYQEAANMELLIIIKSVLTFIGSILLITGMSFFIKGLNRENNFTENEQREISIFKIFSIGSMILVLLFNILDTLYYLDMIYFEIVAPGLGLLPLFFLNRGTMIIFAAFMMTMLALLYILRKSNFYADIVKRKQLFTYIVLITFLLWLGGLIIYLILPMMGSESKAAIYIPYFSLQIILCLVVAGNYLEFVIKTRKGKSIEKTNTKS